MKRILSFLLVACMMFTLVPTAFAGADATFAAKTEKAAYEAKVGEKISVAYQLVPSEETTFGLIAGNITIPAGLTATLTAGTLPTSAFTVYEDEIIIFHEAETVISSANSTICTVEFEAEKPGIYDVKIQAMELFDIDEVPYEGAITESGATLTFKAGAPVVGPDADFDKFKAKGVYYEATSDFENKGLGSGMHMNVTGNPYIYNVGTPEGLAAFEADPLYATLGPIIEGVIKSTKAKYASYTDKDQAYNFVDYQGKHAMYGINNVATQFEDSSWKKCLGAPNMYWMIDADYFAKTDSSATFVIQYFDNAGKFTVRYSKQGGGANKFAITKEGTNTWVTKAFHVTDARLNKGLTGSGLINGDHSGRFESDSETYISKFAVLKTADYNDIMGIVPEEPDLPEDPAGEDACDFKKNSTYVGGEQFEYADKANIDLAEAGIEGLTVERNTAAGVEDTYVKVVADPANEGDYALETYHPGKAKSEDISQEVTKTLNADVESDYIVMSHKFWYPANAYVRFYPTFTFTHNTDSSKVLSGSGFSALIKNTVSQEGALAGTHTYAGKWTEWDFVINTKTLKADLYIDHVYDLTFDMTTGANGTKNLTTDYHLSKITDYKWRFDRKSDAGSAYFDDIQIRSMTAAQYTAAFANETVNVEGTSITTEDLLPVKTTGFGIPVTWTTDNANVTVDANGAISVADATVTYEDVVFTASFAGNTRTFTLDVMKQSKYAEYTFGAKEDKAYGMTSYNVAGNFYTQTKDGLTIRNSIVKFDEPRTFYYIVDDLANPSATAASHEVSKEEYDACELKVGTGKQSYKVKYYNTSAQTGDSAMNRYDAVGPDGDKRAAVWGVGHLRNETKLTKKSTSSMIHFDTGSTFSATDNALVIEVDVLNVGKHAVKLQYCNKAGALSSVSANLTNSGEWVTLKFELTDANFAWTKNTGLGNNKQDMRFQLSDPTYISAVRIYDVKPVEIADADYTKIAVADYDVIINEDNTITAKTAITAEEAADAKLYVAYYNAKGNLVGVATSAQATDGVEQTLVTGKSVGATYNTVDYTLKTFVWDADLKPLR